MPGLPRFARPYPAGKVDAAVQAGGAAILTGLVADVLHTEIRAGIERWRDQHPGAETGSGHGVCVPAVLTKVPLIAEVIAQPDLLGWARRTLRCRQVLLTVAEYRERRPGEAPRDPVEGLHRGPDDPAGAYAIVALGPFTADNGASWFATGSHRLPPDRPPEPASLARAIMDPGDAVVFRSDVLHGVGANVTPDQPLRTLSIGFTKETGSRPTRPTGSWPTFR
jgi:hypothetical protein